MKEAEITFEREGVSGIVPVGAYLAETARRFGVRFAEPCDAGARQHHCEVDVTHGAELLSGRTSAEGKYFEGREDAEGKRLACQAKIEGEGEITIVTKETVEEKPVETEEEYRKRFAELPLEKKISELVQLEAIALSDTLSFVINSPYAIGDKIMGVMAQFGFRKETQEKEAARPEEHRTNGAGDDEPAKANDAEA